MKRVAFFAYCVAAYGPYQAMNMLRMFDVVEAASG